MSATEEARTEVVRASELQEKVVNRIAEIRKPDLFKNYRAELRRYKRRLGKREEKVYEKSNGGFSTSRVRGFKVRVYDEEVLIERPRRPLPAAYYYMPYDRSYGFTSHASHAGLLADARYNRDIRLQRAEEYKEEMQQGRWRDLLSDPIAITAEGDVLNGQHRIAAAADVDWTKAGNNPAFLVVWNADPQEAQYADGSRRTQRDVKTIATRLLNGKGAS